jgi:uncharacterized membrane protein YeaQ/YmgE (transglycosylase-associated protein family)
MFITSWVIIGLVLGSIARIAMPGPAAGGMRVAMLIGVIGALIGGIVGTLVSPDASDPFDLYACLTATNGAMILLFCYRCFAMRFENRTRSPSQPFAETMVSGPSTSPERALVRSPGPWAAASSVMYAVAERVGIRRKTPHI